MKAKEPIIVPDLLWTKEKIFEQLFDNEDDADFGPDDISDRLAVYWVRREAEIQSELPNEDDYIEYIIDLNASLIRWVRQTL